MSTSAITFNGSSSYASGFQQVITRAVGIASLPLQSLQNDLSRLNGRQAALAGLTVNFGQLQAAVSALNNATGGSVSASVSDSSISAAATAGALPGSYKIQVDDPGSSTVTLSKDGLTTVSDPSATGFTTASTFTLTVNGTTHTITPATTSLASLAAAINADGDGVQATIVNIGPSSAPDYRLSLTSTSLGADSIQLNDGTTDVLDTLSTGTDALYKVNSSSTQLHSTSGQVTLAPGVTVHLQSQSSVPATVTVSEDFSVLYSAISNLASTYNSTVDALAQHRGQSGGALTGDSIVATLSGQLNQIAGYTSTTGGTISTLEDIGLSFDQSGHLQFDKSVFAGADSGAIKVFFGSKTTTGFLKTVNDSLNGITDSFKGLLPAELLSVQSQISAKSTKISTEQAKITQLQTNLQARLAQADAAIATLESQKTYFQEMFQATYGNNSNSGN